MVMTHERVKFADRVIVKVMSKFLFMVELQGIVKVKVKISSKVMLKVKFKVKIQVTFRITRYRSG